MHALGPVEVIARGRIEEIADTPDGRRRVRDQVSPRRARRVRRGDRRSGGGRRGAPAASRAAGRRAARRRSRGRGCCRRRSTRAAARSSPAPARAVDDGSSRRCDRQTMPVACISACRWSARPEAAPDEVARHRRGFRPSSPEPRACCAISSAWECRRRRTRGADRGFRRPAAASRTARASPIAAFDLEPKVADDAPSRRGRVTSRAPKRATRAGWKRAKT
jgi:hypothetical protein